MKLYISLLVSLTLISIMGNAQVIYNKQKQDKLLLLENANLIDVVNKKIDQNVNVLIKNDKIEIISEGNINHGSNTKIIDLSGKYIIPGLIDAHVHISNDMRESRGDRVKHLKYFLKGGITTIRDCAGDARILSELKRAVYIEEIEGPDIYFSAFLAGESYYDGNDREGQSVIGWGEKFSPWLQCIKQGDNLDDAMIAAKACGATGVKIYAGFDGEYLKTVVAKAREHGLKVWGHSTLFPAKPSEVVEAGVEVISHSYLLRWDQIPSLDKTMLKSFDKYLNKIDVNNPKLDNLFKLMKEMDCIFDATLYLCNLNYMEWANNFVAQAYKAGVKICAGTDYISDFNRELPFLYDEIDIYVDKCGIKPIDAIRSATIIAAETMGIENEVGSIDKDKYANIVVLSANPLENISNLRRIEKVIKKGKIIK